MGNSFAAEVKGSDCYNISAQAIQELQERIRNVDDTMCGFVQTLDCMRQACELLFRQHANLEKFSVQCTELKESESNLKDIVADEKLAMDLLKSIEESESNHRRTALHSLGRLLNCLIDAGKDMVSDTKGDDTELFLDKYLSKQEQNEKVNDNKNFADWMIESLQKEVKLARELIERNIEDISHLKQRNKLTRESLDCARERNSKNEERLASLQKEYEQLETEKKMLQEKLQEFSADNRMFGKLTSKSQTQTNEIEKSDKQLAVVDETKVDALIALRNELDNEKIERKHIEAELNLLKKKQYIYLQVAVSSKVSSQAPIEDILAEVRKKVECPTSLMQCVTVDIKNNLKGMQHDVPVLYICDASDCNPYTASIDLNRITGAYKGKDKVALVAIHIRSKISTLKTSDCVHQSDRFKNIWGAFDIVNNYNNKMHVCDMNERNVQGLADFVLSKGLRKSVLEAHGLLSELSV